MSKALIFGIAGQDGSYLSEHLLSLGYEVHGMIRRNSTPEHQESRIAHLEHLVTTYYADLTDAASIENVIDLVRPDEIYNLAAQSHVRISFDIPQYTAQVNAVGMLNVLDAYKRIVPKAKFLQASSSEMFGNSVDGDGFQRETTPMQPCSPYGAAKLYAHTILRTYREAYKLHACTSICFNHESPLRRGSNFVTTKIVDGAIRIKLGLSDKLELGNLDSYRDWGFAGDYVKAMHKIINHHTPDDFVIATGETHSIREWCQLAFAELDLDYKKYVVVNPKYIRPNELNYLRGDCTKAKKVLSWQPDTTFEWLLKEMVLQRMLLHIK